MDNIFKYDVEEQRIIRNVKPWKLDPHCFKEVKISALARRVDENTLIVMDSLRAMKVQLAVEPVQMCRIFAKIDADGLQIDDAFGHQRILLGQTFDRSQFNEGHTAQAHARVIRLKRDEAVSLLFNAFERTSSKDCVPCGLSTAKFHRLHVYENCTNPTRQPAQKDGHADGARGRQVQAGQRAPRTSGNAHGWDLMGMEPQTKVLDCVPCGLPTAKFHRLHAYDNCTNPTRQPAQKDGHADGARGRQVQAGQRAPRTSAFGEMIARRLADLSRFNSNAAGGCVGGKQRTNAPTATGASGAVLVRGSAAHFSFHFVCEEPPEPSWLGEVPHIFHFISLCLRGASGAVLVRGSAAHFSFHFVCEEPPEPSWSDEPQ
uniref:Uncharacterized protein n=1 Tax=Globodera rostochiensis TaxID=31243 RepID=A0A914HPK5_GLORO